MLPKMEMYQKDVFSKTAKPLQNFKKSLRKKLLSHFLFQTSCSKKRI